MYKFKMMEEVTSILGAVISSGELEEQSKKSLSCVVPSCKYVAVISYDAGENNGIVSENILKPILASKTRRIFKEEDLQSADIRMLFHLGKDSTSAYGVISPLPCIDNDNMHSLLIFTCDQLTKEMENSLPFFENQLATTINRLKRIRQMTGCIVSNTSQSVCPPVLRRSSHIPVTDIGTILELCADLYDQDGAALQMKVLHYLLKRTNARTGFILLYSSDTAELICQVIGEFIHAVPLRLNISQSMFEEPILKGTTFKLSVFTPEQLRELQEILGCTLEGDIAGQLHSFLCKPVIHRDTKRVIALTCLVNKITESHFNEEDEAIIRECFWYTASVLTSTIALQKERRLKAQTEKMLEVAKRIFRRMDNLNELLREIMIEARCLTHAERCSVFLLDKQTMELVAKVFDGLPTTSDKDEETRQKIMLEDGTEIEHPVEIRIPSTQGICGHVATQGEMLNIKDAYAHPLFYRGVDEETGFRTRNILCFPIMDENGQTVGVAQLCNKIKGHFFTKADEEIARAFSIYCCISIVHSLMFKKVEDAQHRSRLANELMTYHMQNDLAKVNDDSVEWLTIVDVPATTTFLANYNEFTSIPREIPEKSTLLATVSMFENLGLTTRWRMHRRTLARFILMVKRGYRDPPYHNWSHAFSVAHFVYICAKNLPLDTHLTELEVVALFVASLCHDIDHRGTNNSFQVQSQSVLAALYSSEGSVLERHHFSQTVCILNTEGCNVFENISKQEYSRVLDLIRDVILATDLAHHLRILSEIDQMAKEGYDPTSLDHHHLLLCLLMTSADLSDQTKNWRNTRSVADLIYQEFFSQGDLEKALGQKPIEAMDRERACVPDLQISFLDAIILPLYNVLGNLYPVCKDITTVVIRNRENWRKISDKVKTGKISGTGDQIFREKMVDDDFD